MTINTVGNSKDDISIYNGDENHKVWAGSQDNLDAIYDVYSTSTISRTPRPRQVATPVAVPPPPMKEKNKKYKKKLGSSSKEELYPMMNGKANSVSGTLIKPKNQHIYSNQHQPVYVMAHPQTLPNPKFIKHHGNTFSHRPRGRMLMPARPIPPPLVPVANVIIPTTMPKNKKKSKHTIEEPIYLPSNRALSPVSSYQPVNFPHEAYMMHQYATMESQGKTKKREKSQEKQIPKLSKKMTQSMNGLDDPALGDESPFNTGIYRKKGHLNERAFSYSIRQEHRSRSYGSLANLKFATPIPNGVHEVSEKFYYLLIESITSRWFSNFYGLRFTWRLHKQ